MGLGIPLNQTLSKEKCMTLRKQGYFKEMYGGDESDPSIWDHIKSEPYQQEEKIINYLDSGVVIVACGGCIQDIINPDNGMAGCPDLKTDGIWFWSGELSYYVRRYHIKLSDQFISTMIENNWIVDGDLEVDFDNVEFVKE